HFTDVTHDTGLDKLSGHFLGCAVGDYDNDGYEDLYISAYRGGVLLHNEHGARFRDVTHEAGIGPQPWGASCAFADINNDGKLDLYIGCYVQFGPETQPQLCGSGPVQGACNPNVYGAERGVLYLNTGSGRFRDATVEWQAQKTAGKTLGAAFADYDGSGRESLALANDGEPGDLFRNRGTRFENAGISSGTAYDGDGKVHAGMGIDWGDYDNDGRLDLAVATFPQEAKCIYHNDGEGAFTERSGPLGVTPRSLRRLTFGIKWFDYDNDGWLDLALTNGHIQDNIEAADNTQKYRQAPQLFHNLKGSSFAEVSANAGESFQREIVGRGLAVGDFDNDGRVDMLIVDSDGEPLLLHNETPDTGHWLCFKLAGTKSNRDAIGTLVTVTAGGMTQVRRCGTDGSYLSASDRRVHVGLGRAATADSVTVLWPSGITTTLHNIPADRIISLSEGTS
nr:CRTAC1 family protein [Armatimonadota bacterium]